MQSKSVQAGFAARLQKALSEAGIGQVRSADLARRFNRRSGSASVSAAAVRKWLLGEALPTQRRLVVLADLLGVSPDWLRFDEARAATTMMEPDPSSGPRVLALMKIYDQLGESQRQLLEEFAGIVLRAAHRRSPSKRRPCRPHSNHASPT